MRCDCVERSRPDCHQLTDNAFPKDAFFVKPHPLEATTF